MIAIARPLPALRGEFRQFPLVRYPPARRFSAPGNGKMATWPLRARFDHCRKVGKKQAIGGPFYFPFDNGNAQQATPWIVYMKIAQPGAEAIVAAPVWTQHSFAPNVGIANDPQESMFSHVILT